MSGALSNVKRVAWALLLGPLSVPPVLAATAACGSLGPLPAVVELGEGLQQELQSPVAITRLAVGDPKVADVRLNGNKAFLLTGMAAGATSLMIWTACDSAPRQSMVFVQGKAATGLTSAALVPSVDPSLPSQVQTDIRFVEVSRTKLKEASTAIFGQGGNFLFGSPGTQVVNASSGVITGGVAPDNGSFNIGFGGGRVRALINALEGSGQSASFLAGGEIPIPVPSSGSNTITIEYKEFGIRLTLTPTVIAKNRITLKVAPEVSELDYSNAVTISGTPVPALTIRRTWPMARVSSSAA